MSKILNNSATEIQTSQIAKAVSILAVILLHSLSSLFPSTIYTDSNLCFVFIFLNQAARFSVPLFLALSGFGLGRKYQNQKLHIKRYLKRKIIKLLPLYLLWSAILIVIFKFSETWQESNLNIWRNILSGRTDYHLYFVPLIFQLYLIFLILPKLKRHRHHLVLLLLSGLFQAVYFFAIRTSSLQNIPSNKYLLNDQIQYRLISNWIFYFLLGAFMSRFNLDLFRSFRRLKYLIILLIAGGLSWSTYDSYFLLTATQNIVYSTSFIRLPVMVYATGVISAVLLYSNSLFNQSILNSRFLQSIGKHSYAIFLSHTLILRIIESMITGDVTISSLAFATLLLAGGLSIGRFLVL